MRPLIFLSVFLIVIAPVLAGDSATILHHSQDGLIMTTGKGLPNTGSGWAALDEPSIMWSNYVEWPIYTTSANCGVGYVFAGTYLNEPKEAELFAPDGGGVPEWVWSGTEFFVDASDDGFILGAIDEDAAGATVIKWNGPGNGTPEWSTTFPGRYVGSYGPYLVVSNDGSTLAAALTDAGTAELVMFEHDVAVPIVDYLASGYSFPRCLQITADGSYAGLRTNTHVIIYDRDLNAPREVIYIGFGATPFDISGDGDLIAYGWSSLEVRQWTGSSYQLLWTRSESGYYLSKVSISEDGSTIVAGWYASSFNSARITVHNSTSAVPIWSYTFAPSSGLYQESIRDIEMSTDGRYIIVGSWGDDANINPEVHIFDRDAGGTPYFTVDMPGSVFSVDISDDGNYATACGKHVHANVSGHGGDVVAIDLDLAAPDLSVTLTPYLPPIIIPASGGSFDFNVAITNNEATSQNFDAWIMTQLPTGSWFGPVLGPVDLTLLGGISIGRDRSQNVPGGAPSGTYLYEARLGVYPDEIWASDSFEFEKLSAEDGPMVNDWANTGEGFEIWQTGSAIEAPCDYDLISAYPNPFNPETVLSYKLQVASHMNLSVYDISGRKVAELVNGWRDVGRHEVTFDASNLTSGIYLVHLQTGDFTVTQKLILMK